MAQPKSWTLVIVIFFTLFAVEASSQESAAQRDKPTGEVNQDSNQVANGKSKSAAGKKGKKSERHSKQAQTPPPPPQNGMDETGNVDKGTYTVRLRDLEDRVNRLKEQIFRSKARLSLLAETVLEKKIAGAQANISFRNEMGGSFRLFKASLLLDGGPIFQETDDESGSLAKRQHIELFEGPVAPGDHTLEVVLQYKGHGYGIFSYLKGYTFKIKSNYTFTVDEGKSIKLQVIGFEKGDPTTPLEERPAVRYVEEFSEYDVLSGSSAGAKGDE